jgi:hypothetical protein
VRLHPLLARSVDIRDGENVRILLGCLNPHIQSSLKSPPGSLAQFQYLSSPRGVICVSVT